MWCGIQLAASCGNEAPPMGEAVVCRDSLPVMTTHGVSKLISDSGVIRYKVIAEEWRVYDKTNPPRWTFKKGILLQRYDEKFNVNMHITADTAYLYNQNEWELRGRVELHDREQGTQLYTEELFWNMRTGDMHSSVHTRLIEPERAIEGDRFTATVLNNRLTRYHITRSKGFMPMGDDGGNVEQSAEDAEVSPDTVTVDSVPPLREKPVSRRKV